MSFAGGIAINALGNYIPPVAALATQPILAHVLGVDGRGEVAAATAPVLLGIVVLGLGVPESLTHFVARRAPVLHRTTGWSMCVLTVSGAIGALLIAAFSTQLSGGDNDLVQLLLIATSALIPALIVTGLRGVAAGRQAWVLIAAERGISAVTRLAAVAVLAAYGALDVLTATIAISTTTFIGGLAYIFLGRVDGRRHPAENETSRDLPKFHLFAAQIWIGAAAGILYSRLDQLLITPLAGVHELGLYAVAASVSEVILLLTLAIRDVVFTVESESPNDFRAAQAARVSTLLTLAFGLLLAVASPWAIPLFFGADFSGAVPVTLLLILASVLGNPGSVAGAVLSGRGRPVLRSLSLAIGVIVNVLAVVVLVPPLGAIGAALATLVASVLAGNNLNVVWLRLFYRLRISDYFVIRSGDLRMVQHVIGRFVRIPR
jgi:O-antigen/teichoic acid export membrane protein